MNIDFTIALAGNPNCGKTVVFNALTGGRQQIGNWPGVTVDKKYGYFQCQDYKIKVIDLPGAYSTSVLSDEGGAIDEKIACSCLLSGEADAIVNVVDGSNLERNFYMTIQLLEMNMLTILAVNMMDVVKKKGLALDLKQLNKRLEVPVVSLIARKNNGIKELKDSIIALRKKNSYKLGKIMQLDSHYYENNGKKRFILPLSAEINHSIQRLMQVMTINDNAEWLALRLLEGDYFVKTMVSQSVLKLAEREIQNIEMKLGEEPDILIADTRYVLAKQITQTVIQLVKIPKKKSLTQLIDRIVLNRFLGIPIFFAIMYSMFLFSINISGAFQDFFNIISTTIFINGFSHLLMSWHFSVWLITVLASGIGKGISTTITFTPVIGGMFLFLAFLEDSGYMVRAVFVIDRFMQILGLPGKSFVPMIVGFGCNVPAVMSARILENQRDRILTVVMIPFMSCGARLAIFTTFAGAFFPQGGAAIIFFLYLLGILVAVLSGLVLRKTVLPGKLTSLIIELPPYHIPRFSSLWLHMWQRLKNFLLRAGRYIIPICVLIGVLNSVTMKGKIVQNNMKEQSLLSVIGQTITPAFSLFGLKRENWPAVVGLTTGILAKEVVIGTLNTLYSEQRHLIQPSSQFYFWSGLHKAIESVPQNLSQLGSIFKNPITASEISHDDMNKTAYGVMYKKFNGKKAAFAYLLFILLYFPCISTMATIHREIGKRWVLFSVLWGTGLAYVLSTICYQLLTFFDHSGFL